MEWKKNWNDWKGRMFELGKRNGIPNETVKEAIKNFEEKPIEIDGRGVLVYEENDIRWANANGCVKIITKEIGREGIIGLRTKIPKAGFPIKIGLRKGHHEILYPIEMIKEKFSNKISNNLKAAKEAEDRRKNIPDDLLIINGEDYASMTHIENKMIEKIKISISQAIKDGKIPSIKIKNPKASDTQILFSVTSIINALISILKHGCQDVIRREKLKKRSGMTPKS